MYCEFVRLKVILSNSSLHVDGDVERSDYEGDHSLHVCLPEAARGEGRRAEADAAGVEGALVAGNGVLVHGDANVLQNPT